jgi:hypothetical protein
VIYFLLSIGFVNDGTINVITDGELSGDDVFIDGRDRGDRILGRYECFPRPRHESNGLFATGLIFSTSILHFPPFSAFFVYPCMTNERYYFNSVKRSGVGISKRMRGGDDALHKISEISRITRSRSLESVNVCSQ